MRLPSVKNQCRKQWNSATVLLLIFTYVLGIVFSFSHVHDDQYDAAYGFRGSPAGHLHLLILEEEHDHRHNQTHDCLACQFQSKPQAFGVTLSATAISTEFTDLLPATRQAFSLTPTKRLTRAPPVV